jgi:hypothetical protein
MEEAGELHLELSTKGGTFSWLWQETCLRRDHLMEASTPGRYAGCHTNLDGCNRAYVIENGHNSASCGW